ncbi:hypothetical protein HMPREF9145_0419 [Segatella salivae F0493]|uniref:Uncharacterized protein n=1 Tax=Segatella salivae F0493 TaxID=1395125 RepID=U2LCN2_9BACT|nr:hypothetical protein HMPREF9145_0419 [Segatella salivae F0493]
MALMHVCCKLMGFMPCYNLPHFTLQFASFYAAIWLISCCNLAHFMR